VIFVQAGLPVVVCGTGLLRIEELVDDATGGSLLPLPRFRTRFD
jgi:methionyl-tRNA formyltransferase